jgi:hypothetical protein
MKVNESSSGGGGEGGTTVRSETIMGVEISKPNLGELLGTAFANIQPWYNIPNSHQYMKLNTKVIEGKWDPVKSIWDITLEDQVTKKRWTNWAHVFINGTGILDSWNGLKLKASTTSKAHWYIPQIETTVWTSPGRKSQSLVQEVHLFR